MEKITSALRRLDLSQPQQDVYLSLLQQGQASARVLAARTGITRSSVYDQLKFLIELNLVVEFEEDNKNYFGASDIKYLDALLSDKIDRLEQSRDFLAEALPDLMKSFNTVIPKVRTFSGHEGMKQLLKDIMWHHNTKLQIFWTNKASSVYDGTFLLWFDDRRKKRNLTAEIIFSDWTSKKNTSQHFNHTQDKQKFLSLKVSQSMSYIVYDHKVAFISSAAESYGFIVESAEFATLQKLHFNTLWANCQ